MLIDFSVSNFLSFYDTQTLSMKAGKFRNNSSRLSRCGNYKLLKFMAIYGANASGKSNLVNAFDWFQTIVIDGFKTGSYPVYCKVDDRFKDKPSFFQIKIELNKKIYVYGFKTIFFQSIFTEEWLFEELKNGTKKYIFSRNINDKSFMLGDYISNKQLIERLTIYGEDIKSDNSILFLKLMNQNKDSLYAHESKIKILKDIYLWIKYQLDVNSPENAITNYSVLSDSKGLKKITEKLREFSTGIVEFNIVDITPDKIASNLPKDMINEIQQKLLDQKAHNNSNTKPAVLIRMSGVKYNMFIIELTEDGLFAYKTMLFKHKNTDANFSLQDESDGTIRLLDIIEVLLTSDDNKVYIIDEINRKFHPLLTIKFVSEFLELAEKRNVQLIVTTHESQLMNLKLLRRDEISFVNKNESGYSSIHYLDSYKDRFDKKIITDYLKGTYDAVPCFESNNDSLNE